MTEALLQATDLELGYRLSRKRRRRVCGPMTLHLDHGSLVCLLGPNGAGKSTLLRTLAGMQPWLSGQVRLLGEDLDSLSPATLARRLSVVLTEPLTAGNLTARTLVSLGRYPYTDWMGRLSRDDWEAVDGALEMLSAEQLAARPVAELSDGERQKIMIARALAQEQRLMILDEPTSFLDLPRRIEMLGLLRGLTRSTGCSVVLATHHLDLALHYADRLWLLPADGTLQEGSPEDLALSGALESTFSGSQLVFDAERGEFRFAYEQGQRRIQVVGEGLADVWTRHALRRSGFEVEEAGTASTAVEIVDTAEGRRWKWRSADEKGEASTISELLEELNPEAADLPVDRGAALNSGVPATPL